MKKTETEPGMPSDNGQPSVGLERQVVRGNLFTHTALGRQAERINEIESFLFGLIDLLQKKNGLSKEDLMEAVEAVRNEMYDKAEHAHVGVGIRIDGEEEPNFQPVNCAERLPVCQAVCCKLNFPLSIGEIESGQIKWDLGRPYFIRHEASGYCAHLDPEDRCCSVYDQRPGTCRTYTCANDQRIWKDFEGMVLNREWIEANLREDRATLHAALMIPEVTIEEPKSPDPA